MQNIFISFFFPSPSGSKRSMLKYSMHLGLSSLRPRRDVATLAHRISLPRATQVLRNASISRITFALSYYLLYRARGTHSRISRVARQLHWVEFLFLIFFFLPSLLYIARFHRKCSSIRLRYRIKLSVICASQLTDFFNITQYGLLFSHFLTLSAAKSWKSLSLLTRCRLLQRYIYGFINMISNEYPNYRGIKTDVLSPG